MNAERAEALASLPVIDDGNPWIGLASFTEETREYFYGRGPDQLIPGTFKLKANKSNDYFIDRQVQKTRTYTGIEGVKSVCLALQQSERYGTPLGQSLRVMAQENRDMRMNEAEKKAAALPPKLTVPMILFFLPVLFVVILGPTFIKISAMQ